MVLPQSQDVDESLDDLEPRRVSLYFSNETYRLMSMEQERRKQAHGVRPSMSALAEEALIQLLGNGETAASGAYTDRRHATRLVVQRKFLDALEQGATIREAAKVVGVSRTTVYTWLGEDVQFLDTCTKIRGKLMLTPVFVGDEGNR